MELRDAQACMANAVDLATWCERQAIGLDPLMDASRRGRPLAPLETLALLEGVQQLYRRTGQQQILLATMLVKEHVPAPRPWWRRWLG